MMKTDKWLRCYPSNWKGIVVPEAMSHPAKYSSKLIRRIYEHMIEQGWVKEGDRVLDPFGGVALGAWDAAQLGLHWTGNELELKFFRLGQGMDCPGIDKAYWRRYHTRGRKWNELNICPDCGNLLDGNGDTTSFFGMSQRKIPTREAHRYHGNIESWEIKYPHIKGTARLLHGDSRRLLGVIGDSVQVSVSSPPYADISQSGGTEGLKKHGTGLTQGDRCFDEYGVSDGQLGAMKSAGFDAAISSPPYETGGHHKHQMDAYNTNGRGQGFTKESHGYGQGDNFQAAISSPPFLQSEGGTPEPKPGGAIDAALYARHAAGNAKANGYGESDGQLSSMKDGGFSAAISSPPYSAMQVEKNAKSIDRTKQYEIYKKSGGGQTFEQFCHTQDIHSQGYGNSDGQLSSMRDGGFDAAISSPPFEKTEGSMSSLKFKDPESFAAEIERRNGNGNRHAASKEAILRAMHKANEQVYGDTAGNIGNDSGADFWLAARQIVEQVYQALAPGGHAVWVVKDYVKNKQIVPFSAQWQQLCEAVGFQTLHEHHAMLVHHKGTQHTLDGGTVERKTESKSFFRRLAEKNGSPRIDFEVIYCMEKR